MMSWGGNGLRVKVRPGAPGTWNDTGVKHEVYAIKEHGIRSDLKWVDR